MLNRCQISAEERATGVELHEGGDMRDTRWG
jgi:hypothetical protein